tara:strand:- start:576 stop:827 length:252 start_codon:yes stop_codon:yes gene_type:complete
MKNYKFKKFEKTMITRIAIEMAENNIKPNHENIKSTFKKILKRDKETLKNSVDVVYKLLTADVWSRVKKQEIDKKANILKMVK